MVDRAIVGRGVRDPSVLAAMRTVPRERFVHDELAESAYADTPLPIDERQTISQPFIVAWMAEAAVIGPESRVLEVGTGSGYGAAVLSQLAGEVRTIERFERLADDARARLLHLGYDNVTVFHGDGSLGLPEVAPFDAIVVTAGSPIVPPALVDQLTDGGRLVIPVGPEPRLQELVRVRRSGEDNVEESLGPVRFVPLVGNQGWAPDP